MEVRDYVRGNYPSGEPLQVRGYRGEIEIVENSVELVKVSAWYALEINVWDVERLG